MSKDNLIQESEIDMTSLIDSESPASRFEKFKKYLNSLMYDGNKKNLHSFITKLQFKLHVNHDQYPSKEHKMGYVMSHLEEDAACTMNSFYCDHQFLMFERFILLLKQTYDDASHEHTALAKLENL